MNERSCYFASRLLHGLRTGALKEDMAREICNESGWDLDKSPTGWCITERSDDEKA